MSESVLMAEYTGVSKADGSEVHYLQHDALIAAGVEGRGRRIYMMPVCL